MTRAALAFCVTGMALSHWAPPAVAEPVGTALTYQGRLNLQGSPVNTTCDFEFQLFDAAVNGAPVGPTLSFDGQSGNAGPVELTSGLFTVELDFGAGVFNGDALWLEIAVRSPHDPTDQEPFTTLKPRQPLTASPYALHSLNAGHWQASGDGIMNTDSGFVGINRNYRVGIEWFGVHAPVNNGYGGMYVTTEGAAAWPFYGYKAGNQTAWTYLDGGSGDWHVHVDGNRLTVTDEGTVGIRTLSPAYPLHVTGPGSAERTIYAESASNSTQAAAVYGEMTSSGSFGAGVRGRAPHLGVVGEASTSGGTGVTGLATTDTGVGVIGRGASAGVVGSVTQDAFEGIGVAGEGGRYGVRGIADDEEIGAAGVYGTHSGQNLLVYGIHGAIPPTNTSGYGVYGHAPHFGVVGEVTGTGAGVWGFADQGTGILGSGSSGVEGQADGPNGAGVIGNATGPASYGVRGRVQSASGYAGYFTGGRNYFEGNVGCGTETPTNPLSVAGDSDITGRVSIGITGADARLLVRGTAGEDAFRVRVDTATKLLVKDNGGVGIGANFGAVPANGLRTAGSVGIGADPGAFMLVSNGNAAKPGGGSWSVFSDARLKRDVEPIAPGALERLLSLHGRTFQYIEEAIQSRLGLPGRQTGLVAQEVNTVFPEWVDADEEGYLYLTERGTTAIMVEAMRELRAEKDAAIQRLRTENDELRRRVERMEEILARLVEPRHLSRQRSPSDSRR